MVESFYVDFGNFTVGAVSVPMFATASAAQITYIINDAGIETLFVGEQQQYDNALKASDSCPNLQRIIVFDKKTDLHNNGLGFYYSDFIDLGSAKHDKEIAARQAQASPDDIAIIMYTSGTTGEPKGVVLNHSNFLEAMRIHDLALPTFSENDRSIAFLPFSHIFERACCIGYTRTAAPAELAKILRLPEGVCVICGLSLGYASEQPDLKPKLPLPLVIHENHYRTDDIKPELLAYNEEVTAYNAVRSGDKTTNDWGRHIVDYYQTAMKYDMVAKGAIIGMFLNGHYLNAVIPHFCNTGQYAFAKRVVCRYLFCLSRHTDMAFVDQKRIGLRAEIGNFKLITYFRVPYLCTEDFGLFVLNHTLNPGRDTFATASGPMNHQFVQITMKNRM